MDGHGGQVQRKAACNQHCVGELVIIDDDGPSPPPSPPSPALPAQCSTECRVGAHGTQNTCSQWAKTGLKCSEMMLILLGDGGVGPCDCTGCCDHFPFPPPLPPLLPPSPNSPAPSLPPTPPPLPPMTSPLPECTDITLQTQ
eukprot:scaffold125377_cov63-Phaeocystis_antarctica.AAC.1